MTVPVTVSIPEYGRCALDIGESLSHEAAERGEFHVINVGPKLKRVPVRTNLKKLADGDPDMLERLVADFVQRLQALRASAENGNG
jgi:hypothetical protein